MKIAFGTKVTCLWNINNGKFHRNAHEYNSEKRLYDEESKQLEELQDSFEKNGRDEEYLRLGFGFNTGRDLELRMSFGIEKEGHIEQSNGAVQLISPEYQKKSDESLIQKGKNLYTELREQALKKFNSNANKTF